MNIESFLHVLGYLPETYLIKYYNFDRDICLKNQSSAFLKTPEGMGVSQSTVDSIIDFYKIDNSIYNKPLFGLDLNVSDLDFYIETLNQYFLRYHLGMKDIDFAVGFNEADLKDNFDDLLSSKKLNLIEFKSDKAIKEDLLRVLSGPVNNHKFNDLVYLAEKYDLLEHSTNKDVRILYLSKSQDKIKNGQEYFKVFLYILTGFINVDKATEFPTNSLTESAIGFIDKTLSSINLTHIASENFRTNKSCYLRIKRHYKDVKLNKLINRINKLSKKYKKPIIIEYDIDKILNMSLSLNQMSKDRLIGLLRYLNKVRYEMSTYFNGKRFYTLKTGKIYYLEGVERRVIYYDINNLISQVEQELRLKLDKSILTNEFKPIYQSKRNLGNMLTDSLLELPDNILIGIGWKGEGIDMDLSLLDSNKSMISWNSKRASKGLSFSGDITSAPKGATEFITFDGSKINKNDYFLVEVYDYTGGAVEEGTDLTFFLSNFGDFEYIKFSKEILYSESFIVTSRKYILGAIFNLDGKWYFRILNMIGKGYLPAVRYLDYIQPPNLIDKNLYQNYYHG